MKTFTFTYLPVTITGLPSYMGRLPTYYNRSSYAITKMTDVSSGIKMETNKENEWNPDKRFQQNGETSPKNGYTVSMTWEVN